MARTINMLCLETDRDHSHGGSRLGKNLSHHDVHTVVVQSSNHTDGGADTAEHWTGDPDKWVLFGTVPIYRMQRLSYRT